MWDSLARLASPRAATKRNGKQEERIVSFTRAWESLNVSQSFPSVFSDPAELFISQNALVSPETDQSLVPALLDQLLALLIAESSSNPLAMTTDALGPCLEFLLKNEVLHILVKLTHNSTGARGDLVRWFASAISGLEESFLVHSAVHKPLGTRFVDLGPCDSN